eukprot:TRINITY_DN15917_c0_g1_i1.p3 TRINITY_DN15917_c0_g1~~TRINITY_DN15917_c0_g1_i1.p3  ORF type:complete len:147 (-),score=21.40 TRINITY_DN15917_c0_g1_i1:316-699(-)
MGSNMQVTSATRVINSSLTADPVVVNVAGHNLWSNTVTGANDYNRLSWSVNTPLATTDNIGWGLGTFYDYTQVWCSRPCADANNKGNFGTPIWQYVGVDLQYPGAIGPIRQWGVSNGVAYQYAIYIR